MKGLSGIGLWRTDGSGSLLRETKARCPVFLPISCNAHKPKTRTMEDSYPAQTIPVAHHPRQRIPSPDIRLGSPLRHDRGRGGMLKPGTRKILFSRALN